jgi:hypothetical protein
VAGIAVFFRSQRWNVARTLDLCGEAIKVVMLGARGCA